MVALSFKFKLQVLYFHILIKNKEQELGRTMGLKSVYTPDLLLNKGYLHLNKRLS